MKKRELFRITIIKAIIKCDARSAIAQNKTIEKAKPFRKTKERTIPPIGVKGFKPLRGLGVEPQAGCGAEPHKEKP